jgi:hypothetical protein
MKSVKIFISFIIIGTFIMFFSCKHEPDISGLPEICFTGEVLPVFINNCALSGCHDGRGESDMQLNNYSDISRNVTPGNADASRLYQSITAKWESMMPPNQPLSLENRTLIRVWIEQGAALTTCTDNTNPGGNGSGGGGENVVARACFTRDILPVIVSHCATTGCHDAITHKEGYNYTTYSSIRGSVSPGNPANSRLYQSLSGGEEKMPPSGSPQLTAASIDSIRKWILYGALNETCGEVCDTVSPVTFSGTIWPVIQSTCSGCHSGASPSGSVLLASYNNVATVASNGLLIKSLHGTGVTKMPPAGSLSTCRIRQFELWVKNGFPNN